MVLLIVGTGNVEWLLFMGTVYLKLIGAWL